MENNTNELLGIGDSNSSKLDLTVFDYSSYRDSFWKKRYPVSRVLYQLSMFIGWLVIILSVCFLITISTGSGVLKELGIVFLVAGIFAGIVMLFISETILFQIDKNFFAYLDIHKKLELLSDKQSV
jgi:hypothetical protein